MEQATSTTRNVAVVVLALFGPLVVSLLVTGSGHVNVSRALRHAAALDGKIRGRVLAASTGKPLRRARIVVTGSELRETRNTSSDADGRYEVSALPPGRYLVRVSRSGYLPLSYGQDSPFEAGQPLELSSGQVLENIDFDLPRMGVITGTVTDEVGEPIEGVTIRALRQMYRNGKRQLVPTASPSRTDDSGQYRLLGLSPGAYIIVGGIKETWSISRAGITEVMGYAPTYYPGSARAIDARRVTVKSGAESSNIDFTLVPGRAASIGGTALDSRGRPFGEVTLTEAVRGDSFSSFVNIGAATVGNDGAFKIVGIPPGDYLLHASPRRTEDFEPQIAARPVSIDGIDIDDIVLSGLSGGTLTGIVVTDDGSVPPVSRVRITMKDPMNPMDPIVFSNLKNSGTAEMTSEGTFVIRGVFGRSRIQVSVPEDWALSAIERAGQDVTDAALELRSGETVRDVRVILTRRLTTVNGTIGDQRKSRVIQGRVIVFADDPKKWDVGQRYVRAVRPDQNGRWQIKSLPAGSYLAVAVTSVEDGQWNDSEYLESIRSYGEKLTLTEGNVQSLSLRLITLDQR